MALTEEESASPPAKTRDAGGGGERDAGGGGERDAGGGGERDVGGGGEPDAIEEESTPPIEEESVVAGHRGDHQVGVERRSPCRTRRTK